MKDNKPIVSIMITFYNQEKYVDECIDSVIRQHGDFELEILCGDDGSVDCTLLKLEKWKSKYPDIIQIHQMPRDSKKKYEPITRVSNNRVNLLNKAKGDYIAFLDGDDYYIDDFKIQKQIIILENNKSCVCCGHPIKMVWNNKDYNSEIINGKISNDPIIIKNKIYWKYLWFHADTLLFRNIYKDKIECLNRNFFDDNIIACYHLKYGNVAYLPDVMVVYRQVNDSSWNKRINLEKAYVNIAVYNSAIEILNGRKIDSFIKCYSALRELYINRKKNLNINNTIYTIENSNFVKDTIGYKKMSLKLKILYEIKYYFLMHCSLLIRVMRKFRFITYKKCTIK